MYWFQLVFFWYQNVLYISPSIGINYWYLKNFVYLQVVPTFILSTTIWFRWYHNSFCWLQEISKFVLKWFQNFLKFVWYMLPICKGSLTSPLYIDSCWVYLTYWGAWPLLFIWYTCVGGSLISPSIHYILCFMWISV